MAHNILRADRQNPVSPSVMEVCNTPEKMFDGDCSSFDGTQGYCGVHVPAYLTIDPNRNCPVDIGYIRILLMDLGEKDRNHGEEERRYYYRLLYTEDALINNQTRWKVVYDTANDGGHRGWQCFRFDEPAKVRYLRIHAVENRKNNGFHVVQCEAYAEAYSESDAVPCEVHDVVTGGLDTEIGDGMPLSKRLFDIVGVVSRIMQRENNDEYIEMNVHENRMPPLNKIVVEKMEYDESSHMYKIKSRDLESIIMNFANDVKILERNSDGIERAIISPVQTQLSGTRRSNTMFVYISLLLSIGSMLMMILTKIKHVAL